MMTNNIFFKRLPALSAVFVLMLFFSSCKVYQDVEIKEVSKVEFKEFKSTQMLLDVYMVLDNPNWYKITLTDSQIDVFLEGKKMGTLVLTQPIVIPKKSSSTQVITVKSDMKDLDGILGNVFTLMFKDEFEVSGKGNVTGKGFVITKKVDVNFKQTIPREDLGL